MTAWNFFRNCPRRTENLLMNQLKIFWSWNLKGTSDSARLMDIYLKLKGVLTTWKWVTVVNKTGNSRTVVNLLMAVTRKCLRLFQFLISLSGSELDAINDSEPLCPGRTLKIIPVGRLMTVQVHSTPNIHDMKVKDCKSVLRIQ